MPSEPGSSRRGYVEWPARRSPRDSVACLWARQSAAADGRVLPDACIDIIWDGDSLFVAGPDTGPVTVIQRPGLAFAGLRFRPGRAPVFLGVPARDLLDSRVDLADLWGRDLADRLAGRLALAPDLATAALLLDDAVAAQAGHASGPDPIIDGLVGLLRREPAAQGAVRAASRVLTVAGPRAQVPADAAPSAGQRVAGRARRPGWLRRPGTPDA